MKEIPILDKHAELDIAIKAAKSAEKVILDIYQKEFTTFQKKDDSPVTDADLKSNEIIKKILSKNWT